MEETKNTVFTAAHKFKDMPFILTVSLHTERVQANLTYDFTHSKTGQKVVPNKKEQRKMANEYYTVAIPTIYQQLANESGLSLNHHNQHPKYSKYNKVFEPINS